MTTQLHEVLPNSRYRYMTEVQFSTKEERSGVYRILCGKNKKFYIGSSFDMRSRWLHHKSALKRNDHPNPHLQNAYNKYGAESFIYEIIEDVETDMLVEREQFYLDSLDACNHKIGFNICRTAYSCFGVKHSEESKLKISRGNKGKKRTDECKERLSLLMRGKSSISKLTETDVIEIKQRLLKKEPHKSIGFDFGVTSDVIGEIKRGINWKHIRVIGDESFLEKPKRLSDEEVKKIQRMLLDNNSIKYISETFSINRSSIKNIKLGKSHKHLILQNHTYPLGIQKPFKKANNLTLEEANNIEKIVDCHTVFDLAKQFNVSVATIRNIKNGKWHTVFLEKKFNQHCKEQSFLIRNAVNKDMLYFVKKYNAENTLLNHNSLFLSKGTCL